MEQEQIDNAQVIDPEAQLTEEELLKAQSTAADPYLSPNYYGQMQNAQNLMMNKDTLEVIKHYTENEFIDADIKTSKWAIFGRALPLTFLEERDLPIIDMFNNVLRIDALTNLPPHTLTFEQTHQLDQTQLFFYLQAKRAIGTVQGKVNERTLQVTQIGQTINTSTVNSQQQRRGSMLSKLRGLL